MITYVSYMKLLQQKKSEKPYNAKTLILLDYIFIISE